MRVAVELSQEFDVEAHRHANDRGEVPDRTPYGLHHLADDPTVTVRFRPSLTNPVARKLARRLRNRTNGFEVLASLDSAVGPSRRARREDDVVLCMDERTGVPAALLPHVRPVVSNIIWLGRPHTYPRAARATFSRALDRLAAVVVQSDGLARDLLEGWSLDPQRVHRVRVGIDTEFFPAQPWTADTKTVVGVGDDPFRDHHTLIEAVHRTRALGVDAQLELATTMPEVHLDAPWATLHRRRMEGAVRGLYARAGVVALALHSTTRGSGSTVVLEAAASARPVVATRTHAMEALIAHGERGLLVEPGDPDAMAAAITELLGDPERSAAMGRAAREWVQAEYTSAQMSSDLRNVLRGVIVP